MGIILNMIIAYLKKIARVFVALLGPKRTSKGKKLKKKIHINPLLFSNF
jgi:hypothetical protein